MFTGIVTEMGRLEAVVDGVGDRRLVIAAPRTAAGLAIGASVACAGCCLTAVDLGPKRFSVDVSAETLARTNLGAWRAGARVNLERAARLGDELGGHIVLGHVDGVGEVVAVAPIGGSHTVRVRAPAPLHRYIAEKGSIALDGVALTVNEAMGDLFVVNIIPHTWAVTTLRDLRPGARVNLEVDLMARYAARWAQTAPGR